MGHAMRERSRRQSRGGCRQQSRKRGRRRGGDIKKTRWAQKKGNRGGGPEWIILGAEEDEWRGAERTLKGRVILKKRKWHVSGRWREGVPCAFSCQACC